MLSRLIVYCSYLLSASQGYKRFKSFFYDLLENQQSRLKYYFDLFMILLVVISVFLLIYEVKKELSPIAINFEYVVVVIFILEYLLRFWLYGDIHVMIIEQYEKNKYLNLPFYFYQVLPAITKKKLEYMFSTMAIIDLLAIFPSYRSLRILRILLIFRLFKLFRYSKSIKIFSDVLANKRFELYTLGLFAGFVVFIASTAIYLFENEPNGGQVRHLFDAVYWTVVTISTVGYGDITPHTIGGRIVTLALILIGLGVLSFFTSIIVSSFNEKMYQLRENRTLAELEKLHDLVIISGYGRVGKEIIRQMQKDNQKYVIIETDINIVNQAKELGMLVIHGDASDNKILIAAGIQNRAQAIICTTGNDVFNVYITLSSRQLNPDIMIISRLNHKENEKKMLQAGASYVIHPSETAAMIASEYVGQPVASEALHGILTEDKNIMLDTVKVAPGSYIEGIQIGALDFTALKLTLVGIISSNTVHKKHKRYQVHTNHFYFNPVSHFTLHKGDLLLILGRDLSINHFKTQIEKSLLQISILKHE